MKYQELTKQIQFIKEIDKLKYITRKTRLFNSERYENDAEHSWHLAMMVLVLSEYANDKINILKVLKMVLIHDIVEIDAGDTFLYDTAKSHINTEEELKAAERIFGLLPENQATELIAIWKEFEEGETSEARFAKAMDRFEPVLQNASNDGGTWKEFGLDYNTVHQKISGIDKGSNDIWRYTEKLIAEMKNQGVFKISVV